MPWAPEHEARGVQQRSVVQRRAASPVAWLPPAAESRTQRMFDWDGATTDWSGQLYAEHVLIAVQQWLWSTEMLHDVVAQRSVDAVGT